MQTPTQPQKQGTTNQITNIYNINVNMNISNNVNGQGAYNLQRNSPVKPAEDLVIDPYADHHQSSEDGEELEQIDNPFHNIQKN